MFDAYLDFEISIGPRTPAGYPVDASSSVGGEARGTLVPPLDDPGYRAIASQLEALSADEATLESLGQILFQAIFQGPIKEIYARTQGRLQERQGLRVILNIAPSEIDLAAIPWEFLRDPDLGPLALLDTPIVRYLPQSSVIPVLTTALPLKVLVTGAQTAHHAHVERELSAICESLSGLADRVQLTVEPHLTSSKLQHLLRTGAHVWHFVGHGALDPDRKTNVIYLENNAGQPEPISAMHLGILLHRSGVRLVVLDTCHSGKLVIDPFHSMAPALIRAQVPAVVAMQFAAPEKATQAFAGEFYRALAEALPIDSCVTEGRKAVMNEAGLGRADWGIPVVYTRAQDGKLFDLPPPVERTHPEPDAPLPLGAGLKALQALMQIPQVYATVVDCRNNLHITGRRLNVLRVYKELHDCFQQLDDCYAIIYRVRKRLLADQAAGPSEIAWEYLANDVREFQEIVDKLLNCACQVSSAESKAFWVTSLDRARQELGAIVKQRDTAMLDQMIQLIGNVLGREISRVNTRLVDAAADLDLGALVPTLQLVKRSIAGLQLDRAPAIRELDAFGRGVENLAQLAERLDALTATHDVFQEIDDVLRYLEAMLDQDVGELERAWPSLKVKMQELDRGGQAAWAMQLSATGTALEQALAGGRAAEIKEAFLDYRSNVNRGFNRIDQDLRTVCGALHDVGDDLAPILGMIA